MIIDTIDSAENKTKWSLSLWIWNPLIFISLVFVSLVFVSQEVYAKTSYQSSSYSSSSGQNNFQEPSLNLLNGIALHSKVLSSTDTLYPCSAGIRHPINHTDFVSGMDSVNATSNNGRLFAKSSYGDSRFRTLSLDSWLNFLDKSYFYLGTERYGAQYYIEFCYMGPERSLATQGGGPTPFDTSEGLYIMNLNLGSNSQYAQFSKAFFKYEISCDLRNKGNYTSPRATEETPNLYEEDVSWSSDFYPLYGGLMNLETTINPNPKSVPRFCLIKIYFNETSKDVRRYQDANQALELFLDIKRSEF